MWMEVAGFDWDGANLGKLKKHGVTQEEAEDIFYVAPFIDEGSYEKKGEKRYRCLGITSRGRYLTAFFTLRRGLVRNISVRTMRRKEKRIYAEKRNI